MYIFMLKSEQKMSQINRERGRIEQKILEANVGPTSSFPDLKSTCLSTLVTCKWCQPCYKTSQEVSRSNKQVKYFTSSIKTTSLNK
jgi:hypothetical protein